MTAQEIDQLPQKLADHLIDEKTAIWKLLTEFYFCPYRFLGRKIYEEDAVSDFVSTSYDKVKKILEIYDPKICPFSAYFTNSIYAAYLSMERKNSKEKLKKTIIEYSCSEIYEDECKNYSQNEYSETLCASDITEENFYNECKTLNNACLQNRRRPYTIKRFAFKNDEFRWTEKSYEQRNIIITALKHSYYLKANIVSNISKFCNYDEDFLYEKIHFLNNSLERKIEKRAEFIQRRDNAYFFHKRCCIEMKKFVPDTYLHNAIKHKYKKHTLSWMSKNKLLEKNRFKICPSNRTIAKIIGISERQVCYHLAAVRQSANKNEKNS